MFEVKIELEKRNEDMKMTRYLKYLEMEIIC